MVEVKLCEEDSRPKQYWFERDDGTEVGEVFNMGSIKKEITRIEKFGFKVINPNEFD